MGTGWGTSKAALDHVWNDYCYWWSMIPGTQALFFANNRLLFSATPAEMAGYPRPHILVFTWQGNLVEAFCALGFNPYGPDPSGYPCK